MSVDMAALKSEALHHHHEQHGIPLRSRIFGSIRLLNRMGSATAPVSNLPGRVRFMRRIMQRVVGVTAERPLPKFVRDNLVRWNRKRDKAVGALGTVNWLADSFTTYTEPQIGKAAIELLEAAGWTVRLASGGCCGRSSLSKGLLDDAKKKAAGLVGSLARDTEPGSPIVGCEPSCVFTLRDETSALLPDMPEMAAVRDRIRQVEELVVAAIDEGRLRLNDKSWLAGRRVVFHGHCHQKAEVGTAATIALLRRIPGLQVVEIDSGCCGMAGSFGFEAEHYETSMAVGRDRLFPAIEAEPAGTIVAATGVSCRQQIFHGVGRTAWHPLELVREAL
jgi:Fe-S oxidoreductase